MNTTLKNYGVSQEVLYLIAAMIIDSLESKLESFAEFSASYTPEFIVDLRDKLTKAQNMPNDAARTLAHEQARAQMVEMLADTLNKWKLLKRYISHAFTNEDQRRANYSAAGWQYYEPAQQLNWASVIALMNQGSLYIEEYNAVLAANQNMPATFPTQFNAAQAAFAAKQQEFSQAKQIAQAGTNDKIEADNLLYTLIMDVCQDGQVIFEGTITENEFVFSRVADLIAPVGPSGLLVEVINKNTGNAIIGAQVSIVGTDKLQSTNSQGETDITQVKADVEQNLKVAADGFADYFIKFTTQPGVRKTMRVQLEPLMVEVPAEAPIAATPAPPVAQPVPVNG